MKQAINSTTYPDLYAHATAFRMEKTWDTFAIARLIRDRSETGKTPAFLYLGREESELLRQHLSEAFGEESVTTLHESYYMGLKIITVDQESYISTGGSKQSRTIQAPSYSAAS
ncbi:hypothetical protein [Luteolibacter sp. AS25]|uniref:hypothetical protein n=1 Tax=Luteolibacter sp. AS25 TaxID=3135776 RepID=UPI00398B2B47